MNNQHALKSAVSAFLDACPHDRWEFPVGDEAPIPMDSEKRLLMAIKDTRGAIEKEIGLVREQMSLRDCYACVMFAVRMAILTVRSRDTNYLKNGLYGLALDNGRIDYRDVLRALSLVEYCANLAGINLSRELDLLVSLFDGDARSNIQGYFSRSPEWRSIEIMGFTVTGQGSDIAFSKR